MPLDRVGEHKVVDLRRVLLSIAMDAADALLDVHGVPREVEIEEDAGELQVDAFAASSRTHQNPWPILLPEPSLRRCLGAVIPAAKDDDPLARIGGFYLASKQVDGPKVGREDDDLLVRVLLPQGSQPAQELVDLGLPPGRGCVEQLTDAESLLRQGQVDRHGCRLLAGRGGELSRCRVGGQG